MKIFALNNQYIVETNHKAQWTPPFIRHKTVKSCTDAIHVTIPANIYTDTSPVI
jgi:hypothetical protein